jgi:hypothetical protein
MKPLESRLAILKILVALGCAGCGSQFVQVRSPNHPERYSADGPYVAYGYVVFNRTPNPATDLGICKEVFKDIDVPRSPEEMEGRAASTYWPETEGWEHLDLPVRPEHCDELLRHYDTAFANRIIASMPAARAWDVFLFAQANAPFDPSRVALPRVCVDLTRLSGLISASPDEAKHGMVPWRRLMRSEPVRWAPSTFSDYVHEVLALFVARNDVHLNCD